MIYTASKLVERPVLDPDALQCRGWANYFLTFDSRIELNEQVLALARQLGEPVATRIGGEISQKLRPTRAGAAKPRSLSRLYGVGEFPFHTDTAHWLMPCRYIVLVCLTPGEGRRPTYLLDTKELPITDGDRVLLCSSPIRVANGRSSFFSTILGNGRPFIRYDLGCMTPVMADGARALSVFSKAKWTEYIEEIQWIPGKVTVIDNWRVLHGRGASDCSDSDRTLLRVSIR